MNQRGKRRSIAQRVGQKGESIFSEWAVDAGLTRQKVDDDFGIDFFCQVMAPVDSAREEVTGSMLAVQVRSVVGKNRKRIKLDRVDVESALRLEVPFCLVAVDASTRAVYHRFLDLTFLQELYGFLETGNDSITLRLDSMSASMGDFARIMSDATRPGYQQRLRWKKGALDIKQTIPGGRLVLRQGLDGGQALIVAPWLTSVFELDEDARDELTTQYFGTGELPLNNDGIRLGDAVARATRLVDGPTLLTGATEAAVELEIQSGVHRAAATCKQRRLGDQTAYVTPSGLVLSFSDRRREGEQWVHMMGHFVAKARGVALGDGDSDLEFLRLLTEGATISERGKPPIPIGSWDGLSLLGPEIAVVETVFAYLGLGLKEVYLQDLTSLEFMLAIDVVRAFIEKVPMAQFVPAFILDPGGGDPDSDAAWVEAGVEAPIVANLQGRGLVIWFRGKCSLYRRPDGLLAGFRMGALSSWSPELRTERFDKSERPELWLVREWPAIQVMTPIAEIDDHYEGGKELEFGGDVWPLA